MYLILKYDYYKSSLLTHKQSAALEKYNDSLNTENYLPQPYTNSSDKYDLYSIITHKRLKHGVD